jgi:hypothetical protein
MNIAEGISSISAKAYDKRIMFKSFCVSLFIFILAFTGCSWIEPTVENIPSNNLLRPEDMLYLREITRAVVEASRVPAGTMVGEYGPNQTGGTLIRPGGRDCYPAFWIRDYAMSLGCGFISDEEQRHMLLLTARHQPDEEIQLKSGSSIPPGSIPDHITFTAYLSFSPEQWKITKAREEKNGGIFPAWMTPFSLSKWPGNM